MCVVGGDGLNRLAAEQQQQTRSERLTLGQDKKGAQQECADHAGHGHTPLREGASQKPEGFSPGSRPQPSGADWPKWCAAYPAARGEVMARQSRFGFLLVTTPAP